METNSPNVRTALLVMDIQPAIIQMLGEGAAPVVNALQTAIGAARSASIPVIYIIVGFRKGFPEIGEGNHNKSFSALKHSNMPGLEDPTVDPVVAPQPGEMVVTKRRVSAFAGSDLEVILRGRRIEHLVLTGIATSGVVLSTLREASDKDYKLTVLSDACADRDPDVQSVLMTRVFPRQAEVLTVGEWVGVLGK
jgi:nicotinamidase-related amidase